MIYCAECNTELDDTDAMCFLCGRMVSPWDTSDCKLKDEDEAAPEKPSV